MTQRRSASPHRVASSVAFLTVAAVAGSLGGYALHNAFGEPRSVRASSDDRIGTIHPTDPHGANAPFGVSIDPDSVETKSGAEEWKLDVVIENYGDSTGKYAAQYRVYGLGGKEVLPRTMLPVMSASARSHANYIIDIPVGLPDGLYRLPLTVAGSDGSPEGETVLAVERFFEVRSGRIQFMTINEFFSRREVSRANEG